METQAPTIEFFCKWANLTSKRNGFWDFGDIYSVHLQLEKLALIVSEVGEAIEASRKGDMEGLTEELADICIRVFDLSGQLGINLGQAIYEKMTFNETRPFRHNKLA